MGRPAGVLPYPSEDTVEKMVLLIENGSSVTVAAAAVDVDEKLLNAWLERGRERGKGNGPFIEFRRRVEKARARGEAQLVTVMRTAASQGSWQAAAWLLERGFGWQRPSVQGDDNKNQSRPADPLNKDPFAGLDNVEAMEPRRRRKAGS